MSNLKTGDLGYVKLDDKWFKAMIVVRRGTTLGVRLAPKLHSRLIHVEEFIPENKHSDLAGENVKKAGVLARILSGTNHKWDYWRTVFRSKERFKISSSEEVKLRTGTVGWVKTPSHGIFSKWRRSVVKEASKETITVCCGPSLNILTISRDEFLVERVIERELRKWGFIDRLRLIVALRAMDISYRTVTKVSVISENHPHEGLRA